VENIRDQIANAIRQVQSGVRWKPGKGHRHLAKRIRQGHLTPAPPDEPDTYFSTDPRYISLGPAREILL